MAEKSRRFSPYNYVEDNPIIRIDPDGMEGEIVHPKDEKALKVIKNTLTKSDQAFIKLDKNGNIDQKTMDSHKSTSGNYKALKELVDKPKVTVVSVDNKFTEKNGKTEPMGPITPDPPNPKSLVNTTGENCRCGITQLPEAGAPYQSPDNDVHITINSGLSELGKAEVFSHEAYGHDLLYLEGKPSGHIFIPNMAAGGFKEGNTPLKIDISRAIHETLKNYQDANQ